MYWAFIFGAVIVLYLLASIRVLRQYERGVVFFLGKFEGVRGAGLTLIFLPVQQMVRVLCAPSRCKSPRKKSSPRTMSRSISQQSPTTIFLIQKKR